MRVRFSLAAHTDIVFSSQMSMPLFYDLLIAAIIVGTTAPGLIILYHRAKNPNSFEARHPKVSRMIAAFFLFATMILVYASFIEPRLLILTEKTIDLPSVTSTIRIALVSDLHVGPYQSQKDIERGVGLILSKHPDMVVIVGDHIMAHAEDDDRLSFLTPLKEMAEKIPTIAVHGNHEYGISDRDPDLTQRYKYPNRADAVKKFLDDLGITYLVNETKTVPIQSGQPFNFFGADEYLADRIRFDSYDKAKKEGPELPIIMLVHNPAAIYELKDRTPDLILAGHTHGGQVRLPFIGPVGRIETPFPADWYQGAHAISLSTTLYVTSGFGESSARPRLFNPAEVVMLTIE